MKYSKGCLVKNGDRWRAQLKFKDEEGKWHSVKKNLASTGKRDAQRELDAWKAEMEAKAELEAAACEARPSTVTVADYVSQYVEERALSVEASTVTGYRGLLSRTIQGTIGDVPLCDLTPDEVASWMRGISEKYKPATVRKALMLLRSAMKQAVERDVILKDPTRGVKPPKLKKEAPNALDELGRGRLASFLDIAPADPYSVGIRLALYTGMREGEICGLRWKNVDLEARTLRVCESIGRAKSVDIGEEDEGSAVYAGLYVKKPKTKGSERMVSYPEAVARALGARRDAMAAECRRAGVRFTDDMFVIGGVDGSPMHHHTLWERWSHTAAALGLVGTQGKPVTFHDLRHTYATVAIANGIDVKTVSNSMGHTNAAMTLNTYATVDPDARRRAADAMGEVLGDEARRARERGRVIEFRRTGTE